MARRVSERIRLLRLELVETEKATMAPYEDEEGETRDELAGIETMPVSAAGVARRDDDGILLQWLLEIILMDSTGWSAEEVDPYLQSEGKRIVWH